MPNFIEENFRVVPAEEPDRRGQVRVTDLRTNNFMGWMTQEQAEDFFRSQEERELIENGFLNANQTAIDLSKPGALDFIRNRGLTRIAQRQFSGRPLFIEPPGGLAAAIASQTAPRIVEAQDPRTLGTQFGERTPTVSNVASTITARPTQRIIEQFGTTPQRKELGVVGAVKVEDDPTVYTIGPGGRPIGPDPEKGLTGPQVLLSQGFREDEVQTVSREEARNLGIQVPEVAAQQRQIFEQPPAPVTSTPPIQTPPVPEPLGTQVGEKVTSLVDIVDSRPDLQQAVQQGLNINDWWNKTGKSEYPGVSLVPPGDPKIQPPATLETKSAEPPPSGGTVGDPILDETLIAIKGLLEELKRRGQTINPNVTITPEKAAEFLAQAQKEIDPYYSEQLKQARSSLLRDLGYTRDELTRFEGELEQKYGLSVRRLGEQAAEQGFALSGLREQEEAELAQGTQRQLDQQRRQLGFSAGTAGIEFARRFGTQAGFPSPTLPRPARVLGGSSSFIREGGEVPFYEISPSLLEGITGTEQFAQRAATKSREAELEGLFRQEEALKQQRQLTF